MKHINKMSLFLVFTFVISVFTTGLLCFKDVTYPSIWSKLLALADIFTLALTVLAGFTALGDMSAVFVIYDHSVGKEKIIRGTLGRYLLNKPTQYKN